MDTYAYINGVRSASADVKSWISETGGSVGGDANYGYSTITATPWLSFTRAMCMISSLFTRNSS
eukprot:723055-Pyramimonas_sp.AAC.1